MPTRRLWREPDVSREETSSTWHERLALQFLLSRDVHGVVVLAHPTDGREVSAADRFARLCASMDLPVVPVGPDLAKISFPGALGALPGLPEDSAGVAGQFGEQPVVVATGAPILPPTELRLVGTGAVNSARDALSRRLLTRLEPTVILAGHIRATACARGRALQLTAGPIAAPPHECALVDVRLLAAGTLSVRYELARFSAPPEGADVRLECVETLWFFDGVQWSEELAGRQ